MEQPGDDPRGISRQLQNMLSTRGRHRGAPASLPGYPGDAREASPPG